MTDFHGASGVPARSCDQRRQRPRLGQVEAGRDPVERFERERDLDQVRVPAALSHPVDRALHPGRAGLDGSDGRSGREPEVVVAVPVHGDVVTEQVDRLARRGSAAASGVAIPIVSTTATSCAPASTAAS